MSEIMDSQIPTPRTNAQEYDWRDDGEPVDPMVVPASFAKLLETENFIMRYALMDAAKHCKDWVRVFKITHEAKERISKLAQEDMIEE